MAGPLVKSDTLMAGISLDLDRVLRLGKEAQLEFLVPNRDEADGWEIVHTALRNFTRVTASENNAEDGSDVIYRIADKAAVLGSVVRLKNLHIRVLGEVYRVARVPPIAPNVAQVYTLICGERMTRANFDTTKK